MNCLNTRRVGEMGIEIELYRLKSYFLNNVKNKAIILSGISAI